MTINEYLRIYNSDPNIKNLKQFSAINERYDASLFFIESDEYFGCVCFPFFDGNHFVINCYQVAVPNKRLTKKRLLKLAKKHDVEVDTRLSKREIGLALKEASVYNPNLFKVMKNINTMGEIGRTTNSLHPGVTVNLIFFQKNDYDLYDVDDVKQAIRDSLYNYKFLNLYKEKLIEIMRPLDFDYQNL